jgi:hypothetical protein
MLNHVRHQFELLVLTHDRLDVAADQGSYHSRLERAATQTAFLVALRTIIAFFENDTGPYQTRMTASDYCTTAHWDPKVHGRRSLDDLGATRQRINERVAHIDVERARNQAPIAKRATVWKKVDRLLSCFTDRLDADWQTLFYPSLEAVRTGIQAAGRSGPPDLLE